MPHMRTTTASARQPSRLNQSRFAGTLGLLLLGATLALLLLPPALAAQSCTPAPTNMIAWWPGDGHAYDVVNAKEAALLNGARYVPGMISQASGGVAQAFGFVAATEKVRIPESTKTDLSRTNRWTIEAWVRPTSFANALYPTIYSEGTRVASLGLNNGSGRLESWINNNSANTFVSTTNLTLNAWNHVALVRNGSTRTFYINGVAAGSTNTTPTTTPDTTGAAIGNVTQDDTISGFQGQIDELTLYHSALAASDIAAIYAAGSAGKCFGPGCAPALVVQPASQTGYLGDPVEFVGLAMGSPRPTYRWLFNGSPLAGQSGSTLSSPSLTFSQGGDYTLVVSNGCGSVTSLVAHLEVRFCADTPAGLVAWWPADGSALDATSNHNGSAWGNLTYPAGVAGRAFGLNGSDSYVLVPNAPDLSPHAGANGEMSIEAWVFLGQLPQVDPGTGQPRRFVLAKGDSSRWEYGLSINTSGVPEFFVWTSAGATCNSAMGGLITTNEWHHLVGTVKKGQYLRLWQDGNVMAESLVFTNDTSQTASPLYVGRKGDGFFFNGRIDEAALYNRALGTNEIAALYAGGNFGKCYGAGMPAPAFVVQPANTSGYYFLSASLSALALGTPRPDYQWYRSNSPSTWVAIAGATNGTLTYTNLSTSTRGFYRVVATNLYGSVTSAPAWLDVVCHPIVCDTNGEDFETGWNGWTTDNYALWQIGVPHSGPGRAHHGTSLAATVLDGNYPDGSSGSLFSPWISVPAASSNPRLRFWHWFSIDSGGGDYAHCYQRGDFGIVYVVRTDGSSQPLSPEYYNYGDWSRASLDLRAFAGQQVKFQFYFYANCSYPSSGWYIDEVKIEAGDDSMPPFESFEKGLGNWSVYRGNWVVGTPQGGPGRAHGGTNCAALVLNGSYPANSSTALISPRTVVPAAVNNPRLRFWHWFSIDSGGGDSAHCWQGGDYGAVYVIRTNGNWEPISPQYYNYSDWSRASLDLWAYAGQEVHFAFYFYANCSYESSGWFIDEVTVVTNSYQLEGQGDFELGLGDWAPDRGNWQVGVPAGGPGRAHQGTNCAAVVSSGTYPNNVSSSLVSPWVTVPSAALNPRLKFWHWFSIDAGGGDSAHCWQSGDIGQVYVWLTNGTTEAISPQYYWFSDWSPALIDLSKYAGQPLRFLFYFYANCSYTSSGWFIDEVKVETGPDTLAIPDGFENGWGEWSAYRGNFQVGTPQTGPGRAHSGSLCAGVLMNGVYPNYAATYLVSPATIVPPAVQNPKLNFWQWYSIDSGGGDSAHCWDRGDYAAVYVVRTNGAWDLISPEYANSSGWSQVSLPLATYAGQKVRFAYYFYANCSYQSWGWFIDDVFVKRGNLAVVPIADKVVNEESPLTFPVTVIGTDPGACLSYSLAPGAPAGAAIDPETGVFTWTPSECQGPSTNTVGIYVVDYCNGGANDLAFVKITVNELNQPPWLVSTEAVAYVGKTNWISLCSGDPDCPPNPLNYSLLGSVPSGLTINAATGVLRWAPTAAQTGNYTNRVRLCDGGTPNYCVTNTVSVAVTTNAPHSLYVEYVSGSTLQFTLLNGVTNVDYILQQSPALCACPCQMVWQDLTRISPTTAPFTFLYTVPDFDRQIQMFYRLNQVPR